MPLDVNSDDCQWASRKEVLEHFGAFDGTTQSAKHIRPLHWYVACRLVVEGGFDPEEITPRPPFSVRRIAARRAAGQTVPPRYVLTFDPRLGGHGERSVLGGLKTKKVDVVVDKAGIGPVLAVSCKGVTGAFRNLTNRLEETVGECTNLHIAYSALVVGYLAILRANSAETLAGPGGAETVRQNDVAVDATGVPVATVARFMAALSQLTGRKGTRNDVSRYEAIGVGLVNMSFLALGNLLEGYPAADSRIRFEDFFSTMYRQYDERYVMSAPDLASVTRRRVWDEESPVVQQMAALWGVDGLDYLPRVGVPEEEDEE